MKKWLAVAFYLFNFSFSMLYAGEDVLKFSSDDGHYSFTVDCSEAPDLVDWAETKLKPVVTREYARLADEFACEGCRPRKEITYRLKNKMNNPGVMRGATIDLHVSWIRKYIDNRRLGMVIHETWHALERYQAKAPSWLKEGLADWVRYYHYENSPKKVNLATVKADGGYVKTAAFLAWCNGPDGDGFTRKLIRDLRTGDYDHATWWKQTTGLSFDELEATWKDGWTSPFAWKCKWELLLFSRRSVFGKTVLVIVNRGKTTVDEDVGVRLGYETAKESLKGLRPGSKRKFSFADNPTAKPYLIARQFNPPVRVELRMENEK